MRYLIPLLLIGMSCSQFTGQYAFTWPFPSSFTGTFTGSTFSADHIPSGDGHAMAISDSIGVESPQLNSSGFHNCLTSAGNMAQELIEVCGPDAVATATSLGDVVLDNDDIALYYLHDGSGSFLGQVFSINSSGQFASVPGMNLNQVYYISLVAGNSLINSVNLFDPCLDVAPGQPVIWYSVPTPDGGPDLKTCSDTVSLQAVSAGGQWSVVHAPHGSNPIIADMSDPNAQIQLSQPGIYKLVWSETNGPCSAVDTVVVSRIPAPVPDDITIDCTSGATTYTLNVALDPTFGPYVVNGTQFNNTFSLADIPIDSSFDLNISNAHGCDTLLSFDPVICDCITEAGTFDGNDQLLCDGQQLFLPLLNSDSQLDADDSLMFVLHDGTPDSIGSVLAISSGDPIDFVNGWELNSAYTLSLIAANAPGGQIDLSDPCLSIGQSVFVTWAERTLFDLPDTLTGCLGEPLTFEVTATGPLPASLLLTNSASDSLFVTLSDSVGILEITPHDLQTTFVVAADPDNCIDFNRSEITVLAQAPLELADPGITLCNDPANATGVRLDTIFTDPDIAGFWFAPGFTIEDSVLSATSLPTGTFDIIFDTRGSEGDCPGYLYIWQVEVFDCSCPQVVLPDSLIACGNDVLIDLSVYSTVALNSQWRLINPDDHADPPVISGQELIISGSSPGNYIIQLILLDSLDVQCPVEYNLPLRIEKPADAGVQFDFPSFCFGDTNTIDLAAFLTTSSTMGSWSFGGNVIDRLFKIDQLPPGIHEFQYYVPAGIKCPGDSALVIIEIDAEPVLPVEVSNGTCDSGGSIRIDTSGSGLRGLGFYLNGVFSKEPLFDKLSAGPYVLEVENAYGCSFIYDVITIEAEPAVTVDLGNDLYLSPGEEITIEATTNLPPESIQRVTWEDDSDILQTSGLVLVRSFQQSSTITVTVTDINNCVASDDMLITVSDGSTLFIPNVFNPDSPNPDNRRFGISSSAGNVQIKNMGIYDRWGNLVYSQADVQASSDEAYWDGTNGGQKVDPGVFVYRVEVEIDGFSQVLVGDVTLIR